MVQRSFRLVLVASVLAAASIAVAAPTRPARISIKPSSGPPGALVTIRGSGFCSSKRCSRVRIHIYTTVVAKGVRVSSHGTFVRRHLQVPGGTPPGRVGVFASQRLANGKQRKAFAFFEVLITGGGFPSTSSRG